MVNVFLANEGNKTTKVKKVYSTSTQKRLSQLKHTSWSTLGSSNLHLIVQTPNGEDENDWVALHITDFYNELVILGEMATTSDDAEKFSAAGKGFPPGMIYKWREGKGKKPQTVSGPEYVNYTLAYVDGVVNNPAVFPQTDEDKFPEDFIDVAKDLYVKLFRVFAILYGAFLESLKAMDVSQHLNTSFKHYVYFGICHSLMPPEKELTPLKTKVKQFTDQYHEALKKTAASKPKAAKSLQPMTIEESMQI